MFRIEIDKKTLLWNVIRSPSNFITVPEPRHATGKSTKLALQGFGVPNFEDFTAFFIASTDKDIVLINVFCWPLGDLELVTRICTDFPAVLVPARRGRLEESTLVSKA